MKETKFEIVRRELPCCKRTRQEERERILNIIKHTNWNNATGKLSKEFMIEMILKELLGGRKNENIKN